MRRSQTIPRLENGDHLSRVEFERRYEQMPEIKKAELVQGVVYMGSPVYVPHAEPHGQAVLWVFTYQAFTPATRAFDNISVRLDEENEVQPDVSLIIDPDCGGQAQITEEGAIAGAPELVIEIASSSVSMDAHRKMEVYRQHGVQEYILWRVQDEQIDWFRLRRRRFVALRSEEGIVHSEVFPGLWMNGPAMLEGRISDVLKTLQEGLTSKEHRKFVEKLNS